MTHKHNLDEFTPWKIESYELHDTYTHGEPPTHGEQPPLSMATENCTLRATENCTLREEGYRPDPCGNTR